MKLYLRVKKRGNAKIQALHEGLVIGRSTKAHFLIQDPKASGLHAKVVKEGAYFKILDLDSSNGLFYKGKKVKSLRLSPGKEFQIGDTVFFVKARGSNWRSVVYNFLRKELKKGVFENKAQTLYPLSQVLNLTFTQGLQKGESWLIGYTPRSIGAESLDLTILEPKAPKECFTLTKNEKSVIYKTTVPEKVLLNRKSLREQTLKSGDVITIGATSLSVSFQEEA